MKVCVIGNSQVSALRMAIENGLCSTSCSIDFYSIVVSMNLDSIDSIFQYTMVDDGFIRPIGDSHKVFTTVDSAITTGLNFMPYAAIVISAGGYWVFRNRNEHWIFEIGIPEWSADASSGLKIPDVVSSSLFKATTAAMQPHSSTLQMCEQLAKNFPGKIIIQPWPLPSESILENNEWKINRLYGKNAAKVSSYYYKAQYDAILKMASKMRNDIVVLPYPNEDWLENGVTPRQYETADPWHMNDKYGALVMAQVMDVLCDGVASSPVQGNRIKQ